MEIPTTLIFQRLPKNLKRGGSVLKMYNQWIPKFTKKKKLLFLFPSLCNSSAYFSLSPLIFAYSLFPLWSPSAYHLLLVCPGSFHCFVCFYLFIYFSLFFNFNNIIIILFQINPFFFNFPLTILNSTIINNHQQKIPTS